MVFHLSNSRDYPGWQMEWGLMFPFIYLNWSHIALVCVEFCMTMFRFFCFLFLLSLIRWTPLWTLSDSAVTDRHHDNTLSSSRHTDTFFSSPTAVFKQKTVILSKYLRDIFTHTESIYLVCFLLLINPRFYFLSKEGFFFTSLSD